MADINLGEEDDTLSDLSQDDFHTQKSSQNSDSNREYTRQTHNNHVEFFVNEESLFEPNFIVNLFALF
jgi:hypothetical protein